MKGDSLPAGIAYCTSPAEVRHCIDFSGRFALPIVHFVRSVPVRVGD